MTKARKIGINTPYVLFVDMPERKIYMQYVRAETARDYLFRKKDEPQNKQALHYLLKDLARIIAKLH